MKWFFPLNQGGQDCGIHDAGIETFRGDIHRYLARELIQNSIDARLDSSLPVKIEFEHQKLNGGGIPSGDELLRTLQACRQYWPRVADAVIFFEKAISMAAHAHLSVLKISDSNTLGLQGSDDDNEGDWYTLIRCSGSSSKQGGQGGSYGIGKNAPFIASRLRTVLYSTRTQKGDTAFQGVAKLVTHKGPEGIKRQHVGYLGGEDGSSIRGEDLIPPAFLRKSVGTDIYILAFADSGQWEKELLFSILENFWPAIHFGDLEARVGRTVISKTNLSSLLHRFSAEEGFSAHHYYDTFCNPTKRISSHLKRLGDCDLFLSVGTALPKRVAMVRKTGMVIWPKRFNSATDYCGVFMCRNNAGNELLRRMEPPRHDTWDPDYPEKGASRATESEYRKFIRENLSALTHRGDETEIDIPGLSQYLPDDVDSAEAALGNIQPAAEETADQRPNPKDLDPRPMPLKPRRTPRNEDKAGDEGSGGGPSGPPNSTSGGTGGSGPGDKQGTNSRRQLDLIYRTIGIDDVGKNYRIILHGGKKASKNVQLKIFEVGDDSGRVAAGIRSAAILGSSKTLSTSGALIGPFDIPKESSISLVIELQTALRVAMEVEAHEID